tara:strand:+ start:458 stop:1333 length:876 start_codon:yes stop_codon:yes gene_type:complete
MVYLSFLSKTITFFVFVILVFNSCTSRLVNKAAESFIEDVANASANHDDVELITAATPTFLLMLEGLLDDNPNNTTLLTNAAKGYTSYGFLVEPKDRQRARRLYHRAMNFGLRAMSQHPQIAPYLNTPYNEFRHIVQDLDPKAIDTVFWTASSWGAWISVSTESMQALAELPKVILLMEWIIEHDETLNYGSPHTFLGLYYAALPPMLGGKPDKSLYHFDKALEISKHQSLMIYVQKAQYYARQIFDRNLYISLLETVLEKPVDLNPELTLQNVAAKEMARQLLAQTEDFF